MKVKVSQYQKLSLEELRALQAAITEEIQRRQNKASAVEALLAQMREKGLTVADLDLLRTKKPGKKADIKFADPDNPQNSWTGRGKKPVWLANALEAGKSLDDFKVN